METWHIWIIIALLLFIIEIFTSGFAVFCISVGAIAAAIASGLDMGLKEQLIWFSVATLASFVAVRPLMIKYFHKKSKQVQTNTNALIGKTVIVTETIDIDHNSGRVKIDGDVWRAIASEGEIIEIGEKVVVEQVNSTILTVKKL
ncbi:NfeD family protein [Alistipes finegoldii]|uniref:NfeD family protein n=1 Tax=Alistipes finegoldii TaxID=214856 RepID=UPI00248B7832|nr:NfeD family protein [Alistipes finegoldii]